MKNEASLPPRDGVPPHLRDERRVQPLHELVHPEGALGRLRELGGAGDGPGLGEGLDGGELRRARRLRVEGGAAPVRLDLAYRRTRGGEG